MTSVRFDVGVTVEPNSRFRRTMEVRGRACTQAGRRAQQRELLLSRVVVDGVGCLVGTGHGAPQDAHICQPSFNGNANWGFFSVLDGHGGKQAAEYSEHALADVRPSRAPRLVRAPWAHAPVPSGGSQRAPGTRDPALFPSLERRRAVCPSRTGPGVHGRGQGAGARGDYVSGCDVRCSVRPRRRRQGGRRDDGACAVGVVRRVHGLTCCQPDDGGRAAAGDRAGWPGVPVHGQRGRCACRH